MPAESVTAQLSVTTLLDTETKSSAEAVRIQASSKIISTSTPSIPPRSILSAASVGEINTGAMPLKRWTLTVRNHTSRPQPFVLLATPPSFTPLAKPEVVRLSVYQASLLVAPETGSHTFIIPLLGDQVDPEGTGVGPAPVYAVTGCARQKPDTGVPLFVSDYCTLQEGDGVGPGERCAMTMPDGSEAAFSKRKMPKDLDDDDPVANTKGIIGIEVDNSFDMPHADVADQTGYPFVGIGAPNPYNTREITPIVTWDAIPGDAYLLQPSLDTWIVARESAEKGSIFEHTQSTKAQVVSFTTGDFAVEVAFEENGAFTVLSGS